MGFFSGATPVANIDDLMQDDTLNIHEGMSLMEAAYAGIAESEMNWNAIMEAVALEEINEMNTTGIGYSAVAEAGFFSSVVEFFKKVWEKIKSLFKKFMVMLGSMVGKDKDFAKKHGDTIRRSIRNIPSDAEIKGYNFTVNKLADCIKSDGTQKLVDVLTDISGDSPAFNVITIENLDNDKFDASDTADRVRGIICSGMKRHSSSMTDSDMREAAFATARNEEDSKIDIKLDGSSVAMALSQLEGGDKARSDAKKFYSNQEKDWKSVMKTAENIEKEKYKNFKPSTAEDDETKRAKLETEQTKIKQISRTLGICKNMAGYIQTLCSIYLQAVKDEYSQYRKMCVKVVTYRTAKEGAMVSHYSESSGYFGDIQMI